MTLTRRTVITLHEVIRLIHAGFRCPDPHCPGHQRTYRSPEADALALPGFTFGLDIVLLVGQLRLSKHQTVDEIHQHVQERLAALEVTISRREILYLFDAYCTLLRASSEVQDDQEWLQEVKKNGGIIVSVDGIQKDVGNETIYLVRDALDLPSPGGRECALVGDSGHEGAFSTGRSASSVPVLGTITDATSERTLGRRAALAQSAPPGVPVPCATRCVQTRL